MIRVELRTWLTGALLALLLAAFGWASPVDAASCGFEASIAAAAEAEDHHAVDHSDSAPDRSGVNHGPPCAHGHCHHGPIVATSGAQIVVALAPPGSSTLGVAVTFEPPSSSLPLPDQPPRA